MPAVMRESFAGAGLPEDVVEQGRHTPVALVAAGRHGVPARTRPQIVDGEYAGYVSFEILRPGCLRGCRAAFAGVEARGHPIHAEKDALLARAPRVHAKEEHNSTDVPHVRPPQLFSIPYHIHP